MIYLVFIVTLVILAFISGTHSRINSTLIEIKKDLEEVKIHAQNISEISKKESHKNK